LLYNCTWLKIIFFIEKSLFMKNQW
jgi:hypothetical protein